jgi:rRNA-processing protein FCF1
MQVVVNDTNIFIDLINADLLESFFLLPFEVHTTDFIISEIEEPEQSLIVQGFIANHKLKIGSFSDSELNEISEIQSQNGGLSIEDCSVFYYSKRKKYTIISGDRLLTKTARNDGITVRGVLFIFDELVNHNIITTLVAATKLEFIINMGARLPKKECERRLHEWRTF